MENTGIDNEFVSTRYGALRVAHFVSIERPGNPRTIPLARAILFDANFAMAANIEAGWNGIANMCARLAY